MQRNSSPTIASRGPGGPYNQRSAVSSQLSAAGQAGLFGTILFPLHTAPPRPPQKSAEYRFLGRVPACRVEPASALSAATFSDFLPSILHDPLTTFYFLYFFFLLSSLPASRPANQPINRLFPYLVMKVLLFSTPYPVQFRWKPAPTTGFCLSLPVENLVS